MNHFVLQNPKVAEIIQSALLHFEAKRYSLSAWCIMPNHVHVVVTPHNSYSLHTILHSWKSFTATKINTLLHREGAFWERESLDHLIRSADDLQKFITYTHENPVRAGLCKTPEEWKWSSCGIGFQFQPVEVIDPRTTPFVSIRGRGELPHLEKPCGSYFVTFRMMDHLAQGKRKNTDT